ncbi:MAG: nucleoside recognition domain-containing protein, partial [Lachnospiraceae bacterium]
PKLIRTYFQKTGLFNTISYILAAVFSIMVIFNVGPACVLNEAVGASSVKIARDVFFSIVISGFFVTFLLEYGLLEFLGTILEPIMRTIFKLPGKSSVDALTSFVCSPAVGVMVTNSLYKGKIYTAKEAVCITTSFSFVSLGAYAFLSGLAGCEDYYSTIIFTSLLLAFFVAAIMIRIPPIGKKPDTYYDGRMQTKEEQKPQKYSVQIFKDAYFTALSKAEETKPQAFMDALISAFMFGCKVVSYVVSLSVICLILANYTPVISWLGIPVRPILELLRIPDAAIIAPSTLAAFVAMSLPATLISGTGVSAAAGFYIVVLSTCQVIFFTESANAMLDSEIPVDFKDLVIIFLERTIILIPLVALATHIVFGF